jgi:glycosyltransferase involved in cell wall biosynthesis
MPEPYVSVVVPVFNEADNLSPLHAELSEVLGELGRPYELLFVDDGSTDGSVPALKRLADGDGHVRVILFRRNFGQTAALDAGFKEARGEWVVPLDADLQNDPHDIPAMLARAEEGFDVVKGWRRDRKDKAVTRKLPSKVANRLIRRVTGVEVHDLGCTLSVFRREVIQQVNLYGEMHRFIPVYVSRVGGRIAELVVNHRPRIHGTTKYNLSRVFRVLLDLLTVRFLVGYTTKPLYFFGKWGAFSIFLSALLMAFTLWTRFSSTPTIFIKDQPLFLVGIVFGIIGFQTLLMGLLAEMIMRTSFEAQGKTSYVIKEIYSRPGDGD